MDYNEGEYNYGAPGANKPLTHDNITGLQAS